MNKDEDKDKEIEETKETEETEETEQQEAPTEESNLDKALAIGAQYMNNKVSDALDITGQILDVDPNKDLDDVVKDVGVKMGKINKALSTPEGQKLLERLGKFSSEIFVKTTEKPLKEGQRIFNEMLDNQLDTVEKLGWGLLGIMPVIGNMAEIVRIANDLFRAFLKVAGTFSGITIQGIVAINEMQEKMNEGKGVFVDLAKFINKNVKDLNKEVSNVLDETKKNVKQMGIKPKLEKKNENELPKEEKNENEMEKEIMSEKKGGAKCMMRTMKSKDFFLNLGKNCKKRKTHSKKKTKARTKARARARTRRTKRRRM